MVGLMMQALKDNNLYDNTPFFIWSSNLKKADVSKVTSQLNILPTVLNLLGVDYNSNYYIGKDALAPSYSGYVFFNDYSWYDGDVYVENEKITNSGIMDKPTLDKKNKIINDLIKKNDLTLKCDYFRTLK